VADIDEYSATQRMLIDLLKEEGIYYSYYHRIDPFLLRTRLGELDHSEWRRDVVNLLDHLVELRKAGLEPEHEDGRYKAV